jgi:small subunit ribosomal protein S6
MENTTNRLYEGMFVLPQTYVREDQDRAFELIKSALEKHEAVTKYMDVWSERSLAYEINHVREATFVLTYFDASPEAVAKIERTFRITDNILRTLIVKPAPGFDLDTFMKEREEANKESAAVEEAQEEQKEEVKA